MLQQKIIAFFTAVITVLGLWFCPAKPEEGIFPETDPVVKTAFD